MNDAKEYQADLEMSIESRNSILNEIDFMKAEKFCPESERVYLRILNYKDFTDEFMTWFDDKTLMQYFTDTQNKITRDNIINTFLNPNTRIQNCYLFGIFYKENDELIGTIKVGIINKAHNISDLVVLLGNKEYHGKGLAVEAIKLGNDLAINFFNIRKLFGSIYESNIASLKAYIKAGWKIEGRLNDYYLVDGKTEDKILVSYSEGKSMVRQGI
uniref:Putative acetyltransferase n=4 Tax=viral metagenome TaxID=1070528 RepID=A0A6H2A3U2_9ZZZZ